MGFPHKRLRPTPKQTQRSKTRNSNKQNTPVCVKRLQNEKAELSVDGFVENRPRTSHRFNAVSRRGSLVKVRYLWGFSSV